jgi:hypothetical protein
LEEEEREREREERSPACYYSSTNMSRDFSLNTPPTNRSGSISNQPPRSIPVTGIKNNPYLISVSLPPHFLFFFFIPPYLLLPHSESLLQIELSPKGAQSVIAN